MAQETVGSLASALRGEHWLAQELVDLALAVPREAAFSLTAQEMVKVETAALKEAVGLLTAQETVDVVALTLKEGPDS